MPRKRKFDDELGPRMEDEGDKESPVEEEDNEAEDIYNEKERDEMLEDDEISGAEHAFMQGRDANPQKKKRVLRTDHEDTPSVELAAEDSRRGSD